MICADCHSQKKDSQNGVEVGRRFDHLTCIAVFPVPMPGRWLCDSVMVSLLLDFIAGARSMKVH